MPRSRRPRACTTGALAVGDDVVFGVGGAGDPGVLSSSCSAAAAAAAGDGDECAVVGGVVGGGDAGADEVQAGAGGEVGAFVLDGDAVGARPGLQQRDVGVGGAAGDAAAAGDERDGDQTTTSRCRSGCPRRCSRRTGWRRSCAAGRTGRRSTMRGNSSVETSRSSLVCWLRLSWVAAAQVVWLRPIWPLVLAAVVLVVQNQMSL